jgi:hypothetical protein
MPDHPAGGSADPVAARLAALDERVARRLSEARQLTQASRYALVAQETRAALAAALARIQRLERENAEWRAAFNAEVAAEVAGLPEAVRALESALVAAFSAADDDRTEEQQREVYAALDTARARLRQVLGASRP